MKYFALSLAFALPILTMAAPGIPHQLYGQISGVTGSTLNVFANGNTVASTSVTEDGTFGYDPHFFVEDQSGDLAGVTLSFKLDAQSLEEELTFENGGFTELSLTPAFTGSGTGGGGSSTSVSVPTPTPQVTSSASTTTSFDLNGDGVVNIEDFNYFMANWGSAATDLNGDGVTDAKDFTILMSNWS